VAEWVAVGPLERFPRGEALGARAGALPVVITRDDDDCVHAAVDACPHLGLSMVGGLVRRGRLACPHHAYTYDLATGVRMMSGAVLAGSSGVLADDSHRLEMLPVRMVDGHVQVLIS
jgi:nitrite reductase/ring-hydroxylating ferredoxin subunit